MNNIDTRSAVQTSATCSCLSSFPALTAAKLDDRRVRNFTRRFLLRRGGLALIMLVACDLAHADQMTPTSSSVAVARNAFAAFVSEAAQRFEIPEQWIRAVMQVESAGNAQALSPKGAMGLMQIMPDTWTDLRVRYGLGADPCDPHDNIIAGAAYLRELHDRYGEAGFLAAYNAGPARFEDHLATGRPLPIETQNYTAILAPMVAGGRAVRTIMGAESARPWSNAPLFTVRVSSTGMTLDRRPTRMSTINRAPR